MAHPKGLQRRVALCEATKRLESWTMTILKIGVTAVLMAGFVAGGAWAQSQSTNRVAAKTDWSVFVEDNPTECWGVSTPKETVNSRDGRVVAVNRGQTLLMVFYRPSAGAKGQVAFT